MSLEKWVKYQLEAKKERNEIIKKHYMPLTHKGKAIKKAMDREYGKKKGDKVFYASENKGKIKGVAKALEKKKK